MPVAAYFVSQDTEPNEAGAVWVLDAASMNAITVGGESGIHTFRTRESQDMIKAGWGPTPKAAYDCVAIVPDEIDIRLALQQSYFTVHRDAAPLEKHSQAVSFLTRITIPSAAKATIRDELAMLGFRQSTLFPDLSNLAECLRSQVAPK